jgi:DNA-binding PadR family transcriptional regulator
VKAAPAVSETGRSVRVYRLTPAGRKQLDVEQDAYRRMTRAITTILETA